MLALNLHYTVFSYCGRKFEMFPLILGSLHFPELIEIYDNFRNDFDPSHLGRV